MGFADAVKNAILNNYVSFSGRASRSEYWWFFLFFMILSIVSMPVDMAIGYDPLIRLPFPGWGIWFPCLSSFLA